MLSNVQQRTSNMGKFSPVSIIVSFAILSCILSNGAAAAYNKIEEIINEKHLDCKEILEKHPSSTADMASTSDVDDKKATSVYDFTVKDTYGKDVPLEKYRGNVLLIVNIASQCGLAKSNYAKLTQLHKEYYDKGLRILAFPSNQFAGQMPENDGDEMVCHLNDKKVELGEVFAKVNVNGENTIPLYRYLKEKATGFFGNAIKWNFTKFLVDKNGQPVHRYAPTTDPMEIAKEIEKLLDQ